MELNWAHIKTKLREDLVALPHFLRNPVEGMRHLPNWHWPTLLILQTAFAAACSVIGNLIERDWFGLVTGFVVAPITNVLMVTIGAGFFYYTFQFWLKRPVPFQRLYTHVLFASLPLILLTTVHALVPPLLLLGTVTGLMLVYVGFVSEFNIPRRPLQHILFVVFLLHLITWGIQQVQHSTHHKSLQQRASPESLDILEKEMKE